MSSVVDLETRSWSIWWLDSRHPHELDAPVVGAFRNGVGTFLANDTLNGRPIVVRYIWSDITPNSAKWQQAFWMMEERLGKRTGSWSSTGLFQSSHEHSLARVLPQLTVLSTLRCSIPEAIRFWTLQNRKSVMRLADRKKWNPQKKTYSEDCRFATTLGIFTESVQRPSRELA